MLQLKFTTVSPLNISNGEDLEQDFNYTTENGKLYKINPAKLSALLAEKQEIDFSGPVSTGLIGDWVNNFKQDIIRSAAAYSIAVNEGFRKHLTNPRVNGRRQVKEFINSNGNFYVPASSVKGALLTVLGIERLGINPNNASIADRVVFADSAPLAPSAMLVYRTEERPPAQNMICIQPGVSFTLAMHKHGSFNKDVFISSLKKYNSEQINTLLKEVKKYKSKTPGRPKKADIFLEAIKPIEAELKKGTPLINLGFGGGSWFKVNAGIVPKFKSKARGNTNQEAAHSSYSVTIKRELLHIGWCKVEIIEQ